MVNIIITKIICFAAIVKSEEPSDGLESNEGSEVTTETSEPVQVQEMNGEGSATKSAPEESECDSVDSQSTFTYEQLKAKSENPVTGIDFKRREVCFYFISLYNSTC